MKNAMEMIQNSKNDIWQETEKHIVNFKTSNLNLISTANFEGWLGNDNPRCWRGLLGYMRTSFSLQINIINKIQSVMPIYQCHYDIISFFRSSWFKDEVLKNGRVSIIYKKSHFDILKKQL